MTETELLPCPLCEGPASKFSDGGPDERNGYAKTVTISCKGCGLSISRSGDASKGGHADNSQVDKNVVAAWNTRPAPDDLRELREAAERATPGEWVHDGDNVYHERLDQSGRHLACAYVSYRSDDEIYANAAFIAAANPSTVLSLIARIARLESENARLREAIQPFSKFAGIVFERNFNNSDPVDCMTASDGGQVTLFASDFFRARAAVSEPKP